MSVKQKLVRRQTMALLVTILMGVAVWASQEQTQVQPTVLSSQLEQQYFGEQTATEALDALEVKGRAPKTGYARSEFGDGWEKQGLCDTRNSILARDMTETVIDDECRVQKGILNDPYTGTVILFDLIDKIRVKQPPSVSKAAVYS